MCYGPHTSVCSLSSTEIQFCFATQFHEMIECVDPDSTVDTTQSFGDCHITADTCNKHFTCMRGWVRIFSWVESTKLPLQSIRGYARWRRDFAAFSPYKTAYQQPTCLSSSHLCSPSTPTLFAINYSPTCITDSHETFLNALAIEKAKDQDQDI